MTEDKNSGAAARGDSCEDAIPEGYAGGIPPTASNNTDTDTWPLRSFSDDEFALVQRLCAAPSPIGFEGAMINDVIIPEVEAFMPPHWTMHRFAGSPGLVIDTNLQKKNALSVMLIGHADKIRLQVRSVGEDGKIWVNTDSFLPAAIIGHRFNLFVEVPGKEGQYKILRNLTAQAFGAIHFTDPDVRTGQKGVDPKQIYLDTGAYGRDRKKHLEALGVRSGQTAIFARTVERGPTDGTFFGSYLDNALGCFSVIEAARRIAAMDPLNGLRVFFTIATHEEIGLFGSRIAAGVHKPDVVVGVDVNHDYESAPNIAVRRMHRLAMGEGCIISNGAVHHYGLVSFARRLAREQGIPVQIDFDGKMSGNDSMAGALSAIDAASFALGFPVRNMHTSSELAHDGDVLAGVDLLTAFLKGLAEENCTREKLKCSHVSLSQVEDIERIPAVVPKGIS